ncbi:MAG: asparagine synthetase B [Methanomassiliicoccales archaeon PtaU1.Bin124]|nr:MAG: asparagine synthetase B [Methanomassiliicoccales archaeon PtaU1.Bin124]
MVLDRLNDSVRESLGGEEVALMFSGGIDSCIIAQLARRYADVTLYTVGLEGAHDLVVAEATAKRLGLPWRPILIDPRAVRLAVSEIQSILGGMDPLPISFELPLLFVARESEERVIASGQGADEMFGGYARYESMTAEDRSASMRKDTETLISYGSPLEKRLAAHYGKKMRHPFLSPGVIEAAMTLPDELIVHNGERKVALRAIAPTLGLDQEAGRPKKAAQYGSGIMKCMQAEAKRDKMELAVWVVQMRPEANI